MEQTVASGGSLASSSSYYSFSYEPLADLLFRILWEQWVLLLTCPFSGNPFQSVILGICDDQNCLFKLRHDCGEKNNVFVIHVYLLQILK